MKFTALGIYKPYNGNRNLYRIFKEDECMGVILATGTVFLWIVVTVAAFKSMGIILKMINKGFEKIGSKFD